MFLVAFLILALACNFAFGNEQKSALSEYFERHEKVYQPWFDGKKARIIAPQKEPEGLPMAPGKKTAILSCMDARVSPYDIFDLKLGESHVIRNAGGIANTEAFRSLLISQLLLGTDEMLFLHHFDCGMTTFSNDELSLRLENITGLRPDFYLEAYSAPASNVRENVRRMLKNPFLQHTCNIRAAIYVDITPDLQNARHRIIYEDLMKYRKKSEDVIKAGRVIEVKIDDILAQGCR